MMQSNLKKLTPNDKDAYSSFLEHGYHEISLLPLKAEKLSDFYLSTGKTYGVYSEDNELILVAPAFDYHDCRLSNRDMFNAVFNIQEKNIPYAEKLHVPLLCMDVQRINYIAGLMECYDKSNEVFYASVIGEIASRNKNTVICVANTPKLIEALQKVGFSISKINKWYSMALNSSCNFMLETHERAC